jgi:hypothetical protein
VHILLTRTYHNVSSSLELSAMRKIALFALLSGIILAAAAYITEMNDLPGAVELRTPGFIGYVFIISAIAWFSLQLLYNWSKEADPYHY